jgi:DNA-binding GntR family transcriptional regulator
MMAQPRAQNETMQQKVYQELRHSLMVGAFIPGQPVSLRKLSESLQTSLMPVREAVNRLIAERAFEMLPNRKVVIPEMSSKKLSELMYWRKVLEGKAAEQACEQVTPALIKKVGKLNDALLKAVEADDFHLTLIKNQEFHFAIYTAADNSILMPMIESLWLQGGPSIYFSLVSPNVLWNGQFHQQAIEALQSNSPRDLRQAIENDIQVTAEFLLKSHMLRRVKPRPIS